MAEPATATRVARTAGPLSESSQAGAVAGPREVWIGVVVRRAPVTFRATVDRANAATELGTRMGGTVTAIYWTVGAYDLVTIGEFPDDETGSAFLLALGSQGNLRTTTTRAFDRDQMSGILGRPP
jgi:uncharacterized protein with GYD domain